MSLLRILGLSPAAGFSAPVSGASKAKAQKLSNAAETWRQTHQLADQRIALLKAAIKAHYADEHPELGVAVEQGLVKLDEVLDNVDHRLADSLTHASNASDDRVRDAELKNAKTILTEYIGYMKSDPLVAHLDENPWKVKTGLKAMLLDGLTAAARAIG
jgi:hypothetical protein